MRYSIARTGLDSGVEERQEAEVDEVLHALGIKGRASLEEMAAVLGNVPSATEQGLRELEGAGLAIERLVGRRPGWMLSPAGREAYSSQCWESVSSDARAQLVAEYASFLQINTRAKTACCVWQTTSDEHRRVEVLMELDEIHERVDPVLARCGAVVPRFGRYGARLAEALKRAPTDPRYVVSPSVDSFHTVWFECHEDFLVTLGRTRHEEGSW
jgi:DNA-binding transcriptional ArsR family regulator